ncbi:MAG: VWA domain-containing protein [Chloroflexi bacterium]|nr:VWA domain-containing protein [Chloroflexota bacterium]
MSLEIASPLLLLLLLALPLLALRQARLARRWPAIRFPSLSGALRLPQSLRLRTRRLPDLLRVLALGLLILAVARPQIGRTSELVNSEGIDLVLAVDVSYSMAEADMTAQRSRLAVARDVIRDFLANRKNDRIALVAFGREGAAYSPLTLDYNALRDIVKTIDHGKLPEGTAIGHGLATSVNLLRDSRAKSRAVVLLTDGQNNSGDIDPQRAATMAKLLGIRVYTIGVGGLANFPGVPGRGRTLPIFGGVDEESLRSISESTGAAYFRATDPDALRNVYDQIERLEKSQVGGLRYATLDELGPYLLVFGLALLAFEIARRTTVYRRIP